LEIIKSKKVSTKHNLDLGFTLIELLIVVAIVTLLYTTVIPNYTSYVAQSRRVDVQQYMIQRVNILERQYTRKGQYPDVLADEETLYYTLEYSVLSVNTGVADGTAFILKAKPNNAQHNDKCGTLSIDSEGVKQSNIESNAVNNNSCW
jgi:type IV pilus assembly protein PilE